MSFLLAYDVDAIQAYVFSSVRLATIMGASAIIDDFDLAVRNAAVNPPKRTDQADPKTSWSPAQHAITNGGIGLFCFANRDECSSFRSFIEDQFMLRTVDGRITISEPQPFDDFPTACLRLFDDIERQKRIGHPTREPIPLGVARVCSTCGREPVTVRRSRQESDVWEIGPGCARRYASRDDALRQQKKHFDFQIDETDCAALRFQWDFNQLAQDDYLAILVLDGNGIGDRLQGLPTIDAYQSFCREFDKLIKNATQSALKRVCELEAADVGLGGFSPAVVLFQGGDDLVIATRGSLALPLIQTFFHCIQNAEFASQQEPPIRFSAAAAIVRPGFPFRTAHQVAEGLLRRAKQSAQEYPGENILDYAVITESAADAERILADREINDSQGNPLQLSGRPYSLTELDGLQQAAKQLQKSDFPRNGLFDLRNAFTTSALTDASEVSPTRAAEYDVQLRTTIEGWEARIRRNPSLWKTWQLVSGYLPSQPMRYPHSDLADALYLWKSTVDEPAR